MRKTLVATEKVYPFYVSVNKNITPVTTTGVTRGLSHGGQT